MGDYETISGTNDTMQTNAFRSVGRIRKRLRDSLASKSDVAQSEETIFRQVSLYKPGVGTAYDEYRVTIADEALVVEYGGGYSEEGHYTPTHIVEFEELSAEIQEDLVSRLHDYERQLDSEETGLGPNFQ